jgi:hypothetical protein
LTAWSGHSPYLDRVRTVTLATRTVAEVATRSVGWVPSKVIVCPFVETLDRVSLAVTIAVHQDRHARPAHPNSTTSRDTTLELTDRRRVGVCGAQAVLAVTDPQPPSQTGLGDPGAACQLRSGLVALPGDGNDVASELVRIRRGHDVDPSSEDTSSQARSQTTRGHVDAQ